MTRSLKKIGVGILGFYAIGMIAICFSNKKNLYVALEHLDHYAFGMYNDFCHKELLEKGKMLSFNFSVQGNNWNHDLNIYVETLQYRKYLYLEKIMFIYKDEAEIIFIKKKFLLDNSTIDIELDGKKHKIYKTLIDTYKNKIKMFKVNIFKKRKKEGEKIPLKMIVYYSFDDNDIEKSEYLYEGYWYERQKFAPYWMCRLFPEAY